MAFSQLQIGHVQLLGLSGKQNTPKKQKTYQPAPLPPSSAKNPLQNQPPQLVERKNGQGA